MVDQRGVMTGGRLSHASKGLLARKREMADLEKEVLADRKSLQDLKFQLEDILGDMEERTELVNALTEEKWTCRDEMGEADKQLFRLAQELDHLDKITHRTSREIEQKGLEEEKQSHKLNQLHEDIEQSRKAQQKYQSGFREKEAGLHEAEAEFEALRERMSELKAEVRLSEEAKRGIVREMDMVRQYLEDSRKRQHNIRADMEKGEKRQNDCAHQIKELKTELETGYRELDHAEQHMKTADREYQQLREEIREETRRSDALKKDMTFLNEKISENQMDEGEIRLRLENLAERSRETSEHDLPAVFRDYLEDDFDERSAKEIILKEKEKKNRLGEVNLTAIAEYEALKERRDFIKTQRTDLLEAIESLRAAIRKINRKSLEKFTKTFAEVDSKLKDIFPILFNGGTAGLKLTNEEKPLESGVLVEVKPPGKRLSHMGLLSGGEKALVAMALIFAIYMIKPSPFCLLDEVDAPLDEANIDRFNNLLKEIKRESQIIMVTHSRKTMEITDRLFGITMEDRGLSKMVSVDLQNLRHQISVN